MIERLFLVLFLGVLVSSCVQNGEPIEKHTLWLESVDISKQNVYMQDIDLGKSVTIKYDKDLFKVSLIELYECALEHPIFTFYYSNSFYHSI